MKKLKIKRTTKWSNNLLNLIKWLLLFLITMLIIVCYYIFIFKYVLNINDEIIPIYNIIIEDYSESKSNKVPNIWYKSIINDFFNKFTTNSKTIDQKFYDMQSFTIIEYNQDKSISDNIRSDHINSLVSECEYYKEKISNLEIQAYYTKMIHNNLINDLHEILRDVDKWRN